MLAAHSPPPLYEPEQAKRFRHVVSFPKVSCCLPRLYVLQLVKEIDVDASSSFWNHSKGAKVSKVDARNTAKRRSSLIWHASSKPPSFLESPPLAASQTGIVAKGPQPIGARSRSLFVSCVCSAYQVVVEEERPRRARGTAEILRCYPVPIHFQNATLLNSQYYFTAQFPAAGIHSPQPFTVGDNKTYNGYWNAPLLPQKSYSIYYQAVSTANGVRVALGASPFIYAVWL